MRRALSAPAGNITTAGDPARADALAAALESAHGVDADARLTHGFHPYPARMHPEIARAVLALAPRGARVLDPFCGGGTVLVEGLVAGCDVTGSDLNPIALRIAETRCALRDEASRERFVERAAEIAEASEERVRARVDARAPLSRDEAKWWDGHILKELGGLREELLTTEDEADRRALLMVFSSLVVKFSKQRAETSEEEVPRRLRKGLVTEHFLAKSKELSVMWSDLYTAVPSETHDARLVLSDARELRKTLPKQARFDLVLTSPPYVGTYDYVDHQARRWAWLDLEPGALEHDEIGARRRFSAGSDPERGAFRWDAELSKILYSLRGVCVEDARLVLWMGDGEIGGERVPADQQVERLAERCGFEPLALASEERPDWRGGPTRAEHLMMLRAI